MITGIYQSATGLDALMRVQETLATNLANISTTGYKHDEFAVQQSEPARLTVERSTNLKLGVIQMTGVPTHAALAGEGFFAVETPEGRRYTRCGDFQVDAEGRLVTAEGHRVQGQQGDVVVGLNPVVFTESGEIVVGGERMDQLAIVQGEGPLRKVGQTLVTWEDEASILPVEASRVKLMQGALEGSNVNLVESMVDMLAVVRLYEANQKALESQDETLKQLVSSVGRSA